MKVADYLPAIERLHENNDFPERLRAALLASKVISPSFFYSHLPIVCIAVSCPEARLFSYASINMVDLGCVLSGRLQGSSDARSLRRRTLLPHSQRGIRRCGTAGRAGWFIKIFNKLIILIQYVNRMIEEALDTYKTAKRNGAAIDSRLETLINRLFERNLNKVR